MKQMILVVAGLTLGGFATHARSQTYKMTCQVSINRLATRTEPAVNIDTIVTQDVNLLLGRFEIPLASNPRIKLLGDRTSGGIKLQFFDGYKTYSNGTGYIFVDEETGDVTISDINLRDIAKIGVLLEPVNVGYGDPGICQYQLPCVPAYREVGGMEIGKYEARCSF
jgi:hypothetical protein